MHDWQPAVSHEVLVLRARLLQRVRRFFAERSVVEVETPALSQAAATEPALSSLVVDAPDGRRWLHTSPEFPMKRLLASGSGDIYQICKVFRAGESGRSHNPEFTLLEWYRLGKDHHALMDEVQALLSAVLQDLCDFAAAERMSYREAFVRHAGIDPFRADAQELTSCAASQDIHLHGTLEHDEWLDLLLSQIVAPALPNDRPTFIYDYPASQAALARTRPGDPPVAERFELFWGELELANGFSELTDAGEQRARFEREQARRQAGGAPAVRVDERMLTALTQGLSECAGVALGVDRLVMIAAGAESIAEVMAFPWGRA